jgi:hypothetical protein
MFRFSCPYTTLVGVPVANERMKAKPPREFAEHRPKFNSNATSPKHPRWLDPLTPKLSPSPWEIKHEEAAIAKCQIPI